MLATLFVTQGCDSGVGVSSVNNDPNSEKSTEQIRYVYGTFDSGEEHAVRVILDSVCPKNRIWGYARIYVTFRSGYFRALGVIRADFDARVGCGFCVKYRNRRPSRS